MQPTDQTSIAEVYSEQLRSNSGARYHLVTTYSVMKSVSDVVLAKPKSPILRSQFALTSKLLGLRSRCKTLAECTYFNPRNSWYKKYCRSFINVNFMLNCELIWKAQIKTQHFLRGVCMTMLCWQIKSLFELTYLSLSIGISTCETLRESVWKQLMTWLVHKLFSAYFRTSFPR